MADIATLLRADQKKLYRRIDALLVRLRRWLEEDGVAADVVGFLLAEDAGWPSEIDDGATMTAETTTARPSIAQGARRGTR